MKNEKIFGVGIALGSKEELFSLARALIGRGGAIFTPNPVILTMARKNNEYRSILNAATLNIPDGVGVRFAFALRKIRTSVYPGVELGEDLVGYAESFAIFGGASGAAQNAALNLSKKYGKRVAFAMSGYGYNIEAVRHLLRKTHPDICFVCLGAPKQETVVNMIRSASPKTLFLALGGAVDIYSEKIKRAPKIARTLGMEWLFRILKEPRRISALPVLFSFAYRAIIRKI